MKQLLACIIIQPMRTACAWSQMRETEKHSGEKQGASGKSPSVEEMNDMMLQSDILAGMERNAALQLTGFDV